MPHSWPELTTDKVKVPAFPSLKLWHWDIHALFIPYLIFEMSASFRITPALWDKIHHFASFPQTGGMWDKQRISTTAFTDAWKPVSLQQMVLFGRNPSEGTLFAATQFLAGMWSSFGVVTRLMWPAWSIFPLPTEELPVRLAHRVKELDELPHNLSSMPSIRKVKNWYAQSFEVTWSHHPPLLAWLDPHRYLYLGTHHRTIDHTSLRYTPSTHGS